MRAQGLLFGPRVILLAQALDVGSRSLSLGLAGLGNLQAELSLPPVGEDDIESSRLDVDKADHVG